MAGKSIQGEPLLILWTPATGRSMLSVICYAKLLTLCPCNSVIYSLVTMSWPPPF